MNIVRREWDWMEAGARFVVFGETGGDFGFVDHVYACPLEIEVL